MTSLMPRQGAMRTALMAAVTFGGFFLLGYGGILVSGGGHMASPVWPATAFGLCMLLRQSRSRGDDALMLGTMLAAGFLANAAGGAAMALSIGYGIINILAVMTGAWTMRQMERPRLNSARSTLRFMLGAGFGPSLVGAICAYGLVLMVGGKARAVGIEWFIANLLGALMVMPFGMTVSLRQFAKLHLEKRFVEAAVVFSVLCLMTVVAFRLSLYPLQFLVLAAALLTTARFRLMGAGIAIIVISAVALSSPRPFDTPSAMARIELLQLFLAVTSLICVRAAIALNERDFQQMVIERRRRTALRAAHFKSQLLAHVNQEVKAPLSAIIGFSGMLESGSLPPERAHQFAHVIAHNGEMLQRLHDDLNDLAREDAAPLFAQRVALEPTLKSCIQGLRLDTQLGGKPVLLDEMEPALAVSADPVRLAQIINNLIANAYKYGDNYSPIRVRATRLADGYGRIEIAGSGPGILSHERESLFKPFERGRSGRQVPGAELGLSVAKLLVEKQGGRIDFESIPGRQTRFWIDLPLAA